ncbi:MAG: hypothetical protein ACP5T4_01015 [Candidatus Micrarchaeia archaeon]
MKAQASLEFLIILSLIAAMSLVVISTYSHQILPEASALDANRYTTTVSAGENLELAPGYPGEIIQMPGETELGKASYVQLAFYNCSNGYALVNASSSSLMFLQNSIKINIDQFGTGTLGFIPVESGQASAEISYAFYCGNYVENGSVEKSTYVTTAAGSAGTYFARIKSVENKVEYPLSKPQHIINITQSGHCTYVNFWYNPLPISIQCGTTNAWEYRVFSFYCYVDYSTETYTTCLYPNNLSYETTSIGQNYTLAYSMNLSISTPVGTLSAYINSSNTTAKLFLMNESVGYVRIENVSYSGTFAYGGIVANQSVQKYVNQSAFASYENARTNLFSVLNYFNSTASYSQQIYQAIYAYDSAANKLINSKPTELSYCQIANDLVCTAQWPFSFVINAYVTKNINVQNASMFYLGSSINLIRD